jgi:hypothetical protein
VLAKAQDALYAVTERNQTMIPFWLLLVLAGLEVIAALANISEIGKERKPKTHGQVLAIVITQATIAAILTIAATTGISR